MKEVIFDEQSAMDLEFDLIRVMLHNYCLGDTARMRMAELRPSADTAMVRTQLERAREFRDIRREGIGLPAIDFEELLLELRILGMKDSALDPDSFLRIRQASDLVNTIIRFFKLHAERFIALPELLREVYYTKEPIQAIDKVFDPRGQIRDDASPELFEIRQKIAAVRRQIARNFSKELKRFADLGLLADTKEAFVNDRRVLSVISSHKRQVQGAVIGSSKTGSITFIEPQINVPLNFELEMLQDDERTEIRRILQKLSNELRGFLPLLSAYQVVLTEFDFIQAKTRLALELDSELPAISEDQRIEIHQGYHPILLLTNRREGLKTLPQSLVMDKFSRMLVISGPNAGGKSITLKMVGLIQVMFQSGLLVPVAAHSQLSIFHSVLTDIGDHQSIENQLSTYSYRLKRMKHFLDVANKRSLLLLDEFGTGSDPELGGALAEVFFENLYNRKAFGVITTHYANIKLKAAELRNALNGCMLFNMETLSPMYQLSIGQPGSSFTFEVAAINGIPTELIEDAKTRLDDRKVQLDKMIANLQLEKSQVEEINRRQLEAEKLAREAKLDYEKKRSKLEERLKTQDELIEKNNKYLSKGKKMQSFIDAWSSRSKNKELLEEIRKYVAMERSKIDEVLKIEKLKAKVSARKKGKKEPLPKAGQNKIQIGSLVKLLDGGKQTGTVIELDGKKAIVAFGVFKTNVEISKLAFVK